MLKEISLDIGLPKDKGISKMYVTHRTSTKVVPKYLNIQQTQENTFDKLPSVST